MLYHAVELIITVKIYNYAVSVTIYCIVILIVESIS